MRKELLIDRPRNELNFKVKRKYFFGRLDDFQMFFFFVVIKNENLKFFLFHLLCINL